MENADADDDDAEYIPVVWYTLSVVAEGQVLLRRRYAWGVETRFECADGESEKREQAKTEDNEAAILHVDGAEYIAVVADRSVRCWVVDDGDDGSEKIGLSLRQAFQNARLHMEGVAENHLVDSGPFAAAADIVPVAVAVEAFPGASRVE